MEIRNFITFKEIVDTGSFTGAAKKLHYAQSTITSHIQAIEDSMGILLFDRMGKRAMLTEKGKEVYDNVLKLLENYEQIKNISNGKDQITGEIKIMVPDSLMIYKLSPIFKEYKQKYPQVKITHTGTCADIKDNILKGVNDIAFGIDIFREISRLEIECFDELKFSIVHDPSIDKIEKGSNHTILCTENGCSYRKIFNQYLNKNRIEATDQIETGNIELIKTYISRGFGISLLPDYAVEKELKSKKFKSTQVETDEPYMIQMLYSKDKWHSPALKKFIELVRKNLTSNEQKG